MKLTTALLLTALSVPAFAGDPCSEPVISPAPLPPECYAVDISGIWERRQDQNTLVCQYTDGGWLRLNNISLQIPLNDLTQEERCLMMRCIFNTAPWCEE